MYTATVIARNSRRGTPPRSSSASTMLTSTGLSLHPMGTSSGIRTNGVVTPPRISPGHLYILSAMFVPAAANPCDEGERICGRVYDWTGNSTLAELADRAIGLPLAILGLLVLGLFLRWVLYRLVDRFVAPAQGGVLPAKVGRFRWLRRRRAKQQG